MSDDLAATLRAIIERLNRLGLPYMIVGSVAALAYGRSRATQDFDVVVQLDAPSLRALLAELPNDRFYVSEDAAFDALRRLTLFNVIDLATGWKVDIVPLKRRAFSVRELQRRKEIVLLGLSVQVAAPEDLVLAKLEWSHRGGGSARQREDARELLRILGSQLDRDYLAAGVRELGIEHEWAAIEETGSLD